jgi:hypothetical protein
MKRIDAAYDFPQFVICHLSSIICRLTKLCYPENVDRRHFDEQDVWRSAFGEVAFPSGAIAHRLDAEPEIGRKCGMISPAHHGFAGEAALHDRISHQGKASAGQTETRPRNDLV